MQNVIVGTSGHVDHGKTCLIKALTGTNTDRLKEEQKRGITIELGFANLPNEEGQHIGIVDVPGHEKFVKNMLAGIGGIDLVLLVIALDEGVMPQTVEHFEILKMLQINKGMVVFTKSDLVDEDWALMVEEDTKELVKGSFLEGAPSIRVSAFTGENIEMLRSMILSAVRETGRRREETELFRLPIDRVFSMEGFGTVVTGTLLEGSCQVGQEVMIYPEERIVRIRGIQSHSEKAESASAGQRTAINLINIKKEELERGEILAAPGSMSASRLLDAKVRLFSSSERSLRNGDRVHISYGSAQSICKAVLIDQDQINGGEEAYVQLRFDEPVSVKRSDRFIIRFLSPVETFGGGIILDPDADRHKKDQEGIQEALRIKELGSDEEVLEQIIKEQSSRFPECHTLAVRMNFAKTETEALLEVMKKQKKILAVGGRCLIHRDFWQQITGFTEELLNRFHKENPIAGGMEKEEFKSRLIENYRLREGKLGDELLQELVKRGILIVSGTFVALDGFSANYSDELSGMLKEIEDCYKAAGMEAPATEEVLAPFKDKKQARQIISDLVKTGSIVKLNPGAYMAKEHWDQAVKILMDHLEVNPQISLAEYRDLLNTSRKYAVTLLEAFDQQKITKKQGDFRTLLKGGR